MAPPAESPATNTRRGSEPKRATAVSTICRIDSASPNPRLTCRGRNQLKHRPWLFPPDCSGSTRGMPRRSASAIQPVSAANRLAVWPQPCNSTISGAPVFGATGGTCRNIAKLPGLLPKPVTSLSSLDERCGAGGGHCTALIGAGRRAVALAIEEAALIAVLRLRRAMRNSRDHFIWLKFRSFGLALLGRLLRCSKALDIAARRPASFTTA